MLYHKKEFGRRGIKRAESCIKRKDKANKPTLLNVPHPFFISSSCQCSCCGLLIHQEMAVLLTEYTGTKKGNSAINYTVKKFHPECYEYSKTHKSTGDIT